MNSQEPMLVTIFLTVKEISFPRGEVQQPNSLLRDKHCKELDFLYLFPNREFGYTVDREMKLSPIKYFD